MRRKLTASPSRKVQAVIKANKIVSKSKITLVKGLYKCQDMLVISSESLLLKGWNVLMALINITGAFIYLEMVVQ